MIAWLSLLLAGVLEVVWAISMKYSDGFTKLWPSLFTAVTAAMSFFLLALSLRSLPISVAYPIWMGIGIIGVALVGIFWLKEPVNALQSVCIVLIVGGSIGLKVFK